MAERDFKQEFQKIIERMPKANLEALLNAPGKKPSAEQKTAIEEQIALRDAGTGPLTTADQGLRLSAPEERRKIIREGLIAAGFERHWYSPDTGNGAYVEIWRDKASVARGSGGDLITLSWAPKES